MKPRYVYVLIFISLMACTPMKKSYPIKNKVASTTKNMVITCEVISKPFIKKNGMETGAQELYLRLSVQDYFIKFCESSVTKAALLEAYGDQFDAFKTITVEVEVIHDGLWDQCKEDSYEVQSRTGSYIIIHSIVK